MTRINCVPPSELHKKHLVAEYHEISRVFSLVRKLLASGKDPANCGAPDVYTLGPGHVRFFYTKLAWVQNRLADLALEMEMRGINVRAELLKGVADKIPDRFFGQWEPTEDDMKVNRDRLEERLSQMVDKPKRKVPTLDD